VPFRFVALADPPAELASVSAWAVQSLRESNSHALRCRVQAVPCVHVQLSHTIVQQQPYAERRTQSKNRKAEGVMHLFIRARAKEGSGLVVALLKSSTSGSTSAFSVFVGDWQRWCRGAPQRRRLGLALPPLPCFGRSRPGAVLTDCKSAGHQQRINSITTRLNVGWLGQFSVAQSLVVVPSHRVKGRHGGGGAVVLPKRSLYGGV
jgi:hypothetical protein